MISEIPQPSAQPEPQPAQPPVVSSSRTGQLYVFALDAVLAYPQQFSQLMMSLRRYAHSAVVINSNKKLKQADVKAALDNAAISDRYYGEIVCCVSKAKYCASNAAVMIWDTNEDALAKIAEESPRTARVHVQT
jgi:hypothetical protein